MIRAVPHVAAMSPYALADLSAPAGKPLLSLSQNECLRPPSPKALHAAAEALGGGHLYPDPEWRALRSALRELHGIEQGEVLCGNGSMELIGCLAQAFADENSAVLAPAHAYPFFRTAAQQARARFDTAAERELAVCVDGLLAAVKPDTRLVFVANPGNPTGTRIPRSELLRLRDGLPEDVLLVIDEAYGEFADHLDASMFDLVSRGDTVVLRTFSKAYGLAGLRVGWGVFPPAVAQALRKVMNPNNISVAGQAAAAAALADPAYMQETCAQTARLREALRARLRGAGFEMPESYANFVLIRFESSARAQRADAFLRQEGVFLRPQGGVGLADCLRATIGSSADMDRLASLLSEWKAEDEA